MIAAARGVLRVAARVNAPFLGETAAELGVMQRVEQAHHGDRNRAVLHQLRHRPRDRALLGVEADDESREHEHAVRINPMDALRDIAPHVLLLAHLLQRLFVGTFDPDKDREEIRVAHQA